MGSITVVQTSSRRRLSDTSYTVTAEFGALDADNYLNFARMQAQYTGSAAAAQTLFAMAGLDGWTVTAVSVAVASGYTAPPPSAPPSADVGLIVGLVVGVVVALLVLVAVFFFVKKRKGG